MPCTSPVYMCPSASLDNSIYLVAGDRLSVRSSSHAGSDTCRSNAFTSGATSPRFMRLLDTSTGHFVSFDDPRDVRYAILSHVWAKERQPNYIPEQTYQDILAIKAAEPPGAEILTKLSWKIQKACEVAREHGFGFIWVDSCCINKTSSAELSEAINSMFQWYSWAKVCYAFLYDVDDKENHEAVGSHFRRSRWFKRGWTLQELIAPQEVLFLSKEWTLIGTKHSLSVAIWHASGIDPLVLKHERPLASVCVAERMSWAAPRETSKVEDAAYSLIGIFDVNMTPKYGEGTYSFVRLQRTILKRDPDQSLFTWGNCIPLHQLSLARLPSLQRSDLMSEPEPYLLAPHPSNFRDVPRSRDSSHITSITRDQLAQRLGRKVRNAEYIPTSDGIRTTFPIVRYRLDSGGELFLALLSCKDGAGDLMALVLRLSQPTSPDAPMFVGALLGAVPEAGVAFESLSRDYFRLVSLSPEEVNACRDNTPEDSETYIHDLPRIQHVPPRVRSIHNILTTHPFNSEPLNVSLARWSPLLLTRKGYRIETNSQPANRSHIFTLRGGNETITIEFGQCNCSRGRNEGWLRAQVVHLEKASCEEEHVRSWVCRDGVASTSFRLSTRSDRDRYLRLTLSLDHPPGSPSQRSYIIDIQILTFPLDPAAPQRSPPRLLTPPVSPDIDLMNALQIPGAPGAFSESPSSEEFPYPPPTARAIQNTGVPDTQGGSRPERLITVQRNTHLRSRTQDPFEDTRTTRKSRSRVPLQCSLSDIYPGQNAYHERSPKRTSQHRHGMSQSSVAQREQERSPARSSTHASAR
ncbi:heterokaryon incompatibility protein-domain-containing protein [Cerioporus squamosus]|nr:heterokaryon incompatibility protein-domain-containing protein [Cerioporus squamosus]